MTQKNNTISLLLVDDHFIVRAGLAASLSREPKFTVLGEAESLEEAWQLGPSLKPDIALIDMHLGDGDGVQLIEYFREQIPETRCVILSVSVRENDVLRAYAAGAKGYLSKSSERDEIVDAVHNIASGDTYFPSAIHRILATGKSRVPLSQRERDVLLELVKGLRNKEIADTLGLAELTVKQHVSSVLRKMEVEDRTQAAMAAVERGLIQVDQ